MVINSRSGLQNKTYSIKAVISLAKVDKLKLKNKNLR